MGHKTNFKLLKGEIMKWWGKWEHQLDIQWLGWFIVHFGGIIVILQWISKSHYILELQYSLIKLYDDRDLIPKDSGGVWWESFQWCDTEETRSAADWWLLKPIYVQGDH